MASEVGQEGIDLAEDTRPQDQSPPSFLKNAPVTQAPLTTEQRALLQNLEKHAYRYDFFQAVRLLDKAKLQAGATGKAVKTGYARKPEDDAFRLGQEPSMAFSPSTIASFKQGQDKGLSKSRPELAVFFLGVFGANGPLPLHLTEYVRERIRNYGDNSLSAFANIFHHRLLSFFYRAWADNKPHVNLDRPDEDTFSPKVASLFGVSGKGFDSADVIPDFAKYHFAARFSARGKNAEGLLAIIRHYFSMPVKLKQFSGSWFEIPTSERLYLGGLESPHNGCLGSSASLGAKAWECQNKFTLSFGPLDMNHFKRLLPGEAGLSRLLALVRNYLGDEYDWDVQLILKKEFVRGVSLGSFGQLGWTSWLSGKTGDKDFDGLTLNPQRLLL